MCLPFLFTFDLSTTVHYTTALQSLYQTLPFQSEERAVHRSRVAIKPGHRSTRDRRCYIGSIYNWLRSTMSNRWCPRHHSTRFWSAVYSILAVQENDIHKSWDSREQHQCSDQSRWSSNSTAKHDDSYLLFRKSCLQTLLRRIVDETKKSSMYHRSWNKSIVLVRHRLALVQKQATNSLHVNLNQVFSIVIIALCSCRHLIDRQDRTSVPQRQKALHPKSRKYLNCPHPLHRTSTRSSPTKHWATRLDRSDP